MLPLVGIGKAFGENVRRHSGSFTMFNREVTRL
jgi:hypothetical protein